MATSPIYNWPEPDNTDLVKNGALAIRTMGNAIDTTMATMTPKSIVDAKGDLIAATANDTPTRLAVGANNTILMADSTAATGLKWAGTYTTFTPTVTAGSGTFILASATSRYVVIGKMCHWFGKVTITTVGTASGAIVLTLPVNRGATGNAVGYAEETAAVGFQAFIFINASDGATILKGDYTSAIGAGRGIDFNVTYEVA